MTTDQTKEGASEDEAQGARDLVYQVIFKDFCFLAQFIAENGSDTQAIQGLILQMTEHRTESFCEAIRTSYCMGIAVFEGNQAAAVHGLH